MSAEFDLVIRGGMVVDGSGGEPVLADVAVRGGKIAAIADGLATGAEEIDARGLLVTPGFVDVHTHYDGQVTWENRLTPSSEHGVTTAIIGNCGVGFAPCKPNQRDLLVRLMEGVEDIPHPVLAEGLPWCWESFPDYLDFLAGRAFDMDVGAYLPHAPLRVYVMGRRALDLEPGGEDDLQKMAELAREALRAGAIGVATSRTLFHRSSDGNPIPTQRAAEDELFALAQVMREEDAGVFQLTGDDLDRPQGVDLCRRLGQVSGRPVTFSFGTANAPPFGWPDALRHVAEANRVGPPLHPQILPRAVGLLLGWELTLNPFYTTPTCRSLEHLPLDQRIVELRRPEVRDRILGEAVESRPTNPLGAYVRQFGSMFLLGDPPQYEQPPQDSIAGLAARRGQTPEALAYDLMLREGGRAQLYLAMANFPEGKLDAVETMLRHPDTIPGLGDGGAHCGSICDGSYSTFLLSHFARDRRDGGRLPIPLAVRKLTSMPAQALGLLDRGRLAPGYKADINVIDFAQLRLRPPEVRYDLPGGGRRLVQRAEGYRATIVSGTPVYRDGEATGALPGRLVRGGRSAPASISQGEPR